MFNNKKNEKFDSSKINEESLAKYKKDFSNQGFLDKIAKYGKVIGLKILYQAAQMYYVMQKPEVPATDKMIIVGALGYFISTIDFIPDVIPVLGYTDDAAAIAYAFIRVQGYIDEDVKSNAKALLAKVFGASVYEEL